ncbi:DUF5719 family protein [Streptomyces tsukubensis]|uniref:Secreted protein n=1 Tax=Streptomyces tsukubensis TaxID=83656 RepID=A0A1V3ZY56_9ACTN|nr:DUF5719 family protein [Streptomyces tsukubensis]OON71301.1 hypothetical protein B1H18_34460 [Streptomyces tsukubensis]QFR93945.1 hypothetical protein GBW32_13845 [Streptomyces tsukubensis]
MNRATLSLIGAAAALAAITGLASLTTTEGKADDSAGTAAVLPVERSSVLCPAPGDSDLAETAYDSYTPPLKSAGTGGGAVLRSSPQEMKEGQGAQDALKPGKAQLTAKEPGKPVSADASGGDVPALVGLADGALAPGWAVQQTTTLTAGAGRGLLGIGCQAPDTSFWLPGVSTNKGRSDYVHLTNPDDTAAVADIDLYGKDGSIKSDVGEAIQIQPHSSVPVLLSTLTDSPQDDLTAHVTARSGRIAAAVHASDEKTGSDWLTASGDPAEHLVMPGIPADATSVRLVAFAPGQEDADLKIQLASPTGTITPAGHETLHVKAGMTAGTELGAVTRGEAGSLLLSSTGSRTPVVAALRVTRGKGDKQETAFIPATGPVGARATTAGNHAKGSKLSFVAPGAAAKVKVTASVGTEGGTVTTKTYSLKGGSAQTVEPPVPTGLKGTYALTVEPVSGGPVHASRELDADGDDAHGVPMFTIQTLPDDRGTVEVPRAKQDLTVLDK